MDNGASSYRRFLDGDESGFDSLMEEYFDNLIFFINRYVKDLDVAEDIAIDAFTDLVVHKSRYNFKVTFKTYLFMIGRSLALNYLKRRNKLKFVEYEEAGELVAKDNIEAQVLKDEQSRRVNEAIGTLPEDMQAAVHLVYFENLSYDEAARVMKKNKKQIDNLLYRAKGTLRSILGKDGDML